MTIWPLFFPIPMVRSANVYPRGLFFLGMIVCLRKPSVRALLAEGLQGLGGRCVSTWGKPSAEGFLRGDETYTSHPSGVKVCDCEGSFLAPLLALRFSPIRMLLLQLRRVSTDVRLWWK